MELDARDFMKSLGSEVTGSAMGTADNGHFLNDEQRGSSSVAAGYRAFLNPTAATVLAAILFISIPHIQ